MNYFCEVCHKTFNGIKPFADHMKSSIHKKKASGSTESEKTVMDYERNESISDPHIKMFGSQYKCTLCDAMLNSPKQIEAHITGKKHASMLCKKPLSFKEDTSDILIPSNINLPYSFSFHGIKTENISLNIKVFGVNDPVHF